MDAALRFNPCFNGTYSLTLQHQPLTVNSFCFNPCFNGTYSLTDYKFLEDLRYYKSFNPCFNGTYSLTEVVKYNSSGEIVF